MNISLVICTYMRPDSLLKLLYSIEAQIIKPNEIIIVDGSTTLDTQIVLKNYDFDVTYFLVDDDNRGLTKQRNFGVSKTDKSTDVVAFLDDDLILEPNYFEEIIKTYQQNPKAIGVGGIDLVENTYSLKNPNQMYSKFEYFELDGWIKKEGMRNKVRKIFGLMTDLQPELIPSFSHGRTGLPPNDKLYEVEHFMGGIATYKKDLFHKIAFSKYFEGYGLYEDYDFCVRAIKHGKLYINTKAKVHHYHAPSGRPNQYDYGKMVVRNGWYVWRLKNPQPDLQSKIKWHAITILLMVLRFFNAFTTKKSKQAFTESLGRGVAWIQLFFDKPTIEY